MTLELSNVSITLGGRQLVKGLDLKLAPGEVVGLLGFGGHQPTGPVLHGGRPDCAEW